MDCTEVPETHYEPRDLGFVRPADLTPEEAPSLWEYENSPEEEREEVIEAAR